MSSAPTPYSPELNAYAVARSDHDPIMEELAAESDDIQGGKLASMRMAPEQAALMTVLTRSIGARRALEIGTFTGYGSIAIARGLAEDGLLITCDIDERNTMLARRYWQKLGLEEKIQLRIAPALETLRSLDRAEPFDFAFIDADKGNYPAYYEECLRLVRPGGLIAIDNVFWRGEVIGPTEDPDVAAIRELNDRVASDPRISSRAMVSVADGLTLVVR